jgi:hypothetical protein
MDALLLASRFTFGTTRVKEVDPVSTVFLMVTVTSVPISEASVRMSAPEKLRVW